MPTVLITAEQRRTAEARAENRIEAGLFNRMRKGRDERLRRAVDGVLGELAFEEVLRRSTIAHETTIDDSGPDEADFFLPTVPLITSRSTLRTVAEPRPAYVAGGPLRSVDVKIGVTDRMPNPEWCFGFPVDQHPERKHVIVLGYINPARTEVLFWGCIPGNLLRGRLPVTHNCFARFKYETQNLEAKLREFDRTFRLIGTLL